MKTRRFLIGVLFVFASAAPVWAADQTDVVESQKELAAQGYSWAQAALGFMYAHGQGVPQDYAEALKWYRLAAAKGNAHAQYNLGVMYERGQGVPQNFAEALGWFRMAADQGLAVAQNNLGYLHERGLGIQLRSASNGARDH